MKHPFKLIHIGAENTVTGSCHLMIMENGINIMVDCGLSMGADKVISFSEIPVKVSDIQYLFITHAHVDHIGRIPELIEEGFCGEIICTHSTKYLLKPMLEDALSFSDKKEKKKKSIFDTIENLSWGFKYNEVCSLKKGIKFKLGNAGHILGSSFIRFEIPVKGVIFSVIFSGDLGNFDTPILPDPDKPDYCDLLVLESTYGDRVHGNRENRIEILGKILNKALEDDGKVFIPAFSLGRTQELIFEMDRLFSEGIIKRKIPVFIDSPLGEKITGIYSGLSKFWDKESKKLLQEGDHPIDFDHLFSVGNYRNHRKITGIEAPAIIIAGSGMCTGGRIIDHLINGIDNPLNDIIFVGYQAKGTLGRDIIRYSNSDNGYVRIKGNKILINANVYKLSGYSAHADQKGIIDFIKSMPSKPAKIKLVHGENVAKKILKQKLEQINCYVE